MFHRNACFAFKQQCQQGTQGPFPGRRENLLVPPDAVQHIPVLEDAQKFVVCCDLVEIGSLLIGKEQIWLPDGVKH